MSNYLITYFSFDTLRLSIVLAVDRGRIQEMKRKISSISTRLYSLFGVLMFYRGELISPLRVARAYCARSRPRSDLLVSCAP